jgi:hypothetical protein
MAIDTTQLVPGFWEIAQLEAGGLKFYPYFGNRDPVTQAKLWRQSRSQGQVAAMLDSLRAQGCDFIANCLTAAGPQDGKPVTNALPGQSWHQWGEAIDCYLVDAAGNPDWNNDAAYAEFGRVGDAAGLRWGGHFHDNDHWQFRRTEPDQAFGSLKGINDALALKWPAFG